MQKSILLAAHFMKPNTCNLVKSLYSETDTIIYIYIYIYHSFFYFNLMFEVIKFRLPSWHKLLSVQRLSSCIHSKDITATYAISEHYWLTAECIWYMGLVWAERRNNTHTLPIVRPLWVVFLQWGSFINVFSFKVYNHFNAFGYKPHLLFTLVTHLNWFLYCMK